MIKNILGVYFLMNHVIFVDNYALYVESSK